MEGARQMIVIALGIVSVLACEGCAVFSNSDPLPVVEPYHSREISAETRRAMKIAVPAPLGAQSYQTYSGQQNPPDQGLYMIGKTLAKHGVPAPSTSYNPGARQRHVELTPSGDDRVSVSFVTGLNDGVLDQSRWSATPALRVFQGQLSAQRLVPGRYEEREELDAEFALAAPRELTGFGFDIGVAPRASYATEGDFSVRRIGAEFRFGQDIDQRGSDAGLPSWYFFAGANGEAIIFNNGAAGSGLSLMNGLQLRDQVTVGDIQAGLSVKRFGTNFGISYIRREVEFDLNDAESIQRNEDFGGITLTWRR